MKRKAVTALVIAASLALTPVLGNIATITASAAAEDENAQKVKDGSFAYFQDKGADAALDALINSKYSDLTVKGDEKDATSFENMLKTIQWIKECNRLRELNGLEPLLVNDTLMAMAQADANYSDTVVGHAQQFSVAENCAWNFGSNPFKQWYDEEKEIYDQMPNPGWTSDTGHYLNIITPSYKTTGFAINTRGTRYPYTYVQVFSGYNDGIPVDEYEKQLLEYYQSIQSSTEEPMTYTVTFKDGDTVLKTETVGEGEAATAPEVLDKEGYTFAGWDVEFANITSDLTVNAKWVEDEGETPTPAPTTNYTVTFKDGGTILETQTVENGEAAIAPAAPMKTGYTSSWDKEFDNVTTDLTVNAKWTANTYKITYDVNGGNKLDTISKDVTYDADYGTLAAPKRTGYTFSGWYTEKTGGTKITATGSVKITSDTTLYAHWSKVAKPATVKKPTVKNSAKKTMKISFKKVKDAVGYEISYSTKSNMKSAKLVTTKKTSVTIKKLTKGKKYYVQVRAYKLDSAGKKVYSKAYSKKANVTIKK